MREWGLPICGTSKGMRKRPKQCRGELEAVYSSGLGQVFRLISGRGEWLFVCLLCGYETWGRRSRSRCSRRAVREETEEGC